MTASRSSFTPWPVLPDASKISSSLTPSSLTSSWTTLGTSAAGRSILFMTGMMTKFCSMARYRLARVCASTPWLASTSKIAPSTACNDRDTSYEKSTCPGVSMRLSVYPSYSILTGCSLMVMPRSRSSSIWSSIWSFMSLAATVCVSSKNLSASVDLPWSMCAMMQKFRMSCIACSIV